MKKIIAATSLALFALTPAAALAQDSSADTNPASSGQETASYPAPGGAAGENGTSKWAYGTLAGLGVAAVVGTSIAVASNGDDDDNVTTGTTGTTGTTN